ncbi:MAG: hypothetical protein ACRBB2_02370 [Nitrosopumilus sp.]
MKQIIFSIFSIVALILFFPQVNAQTDSIEEVDHKSLTITINHDGKMTVTHQIKNSDEPKELNFVKGTVSNLKIIDRFAQSEIIKIDKEANSYIISPNQGEISVQYDIDDAITLNNNFWTLDFLYLESTSFFLPDEVDLIFTNERPVYLDEKKGFACHGCQLLLEYSIDEPKNIIEVNVENKKFFVEIRTFSQVKNFEFDGSRDKINFDIDNQNKFLTIIIPIELLDGPYEMYLGDEKILFQDYINNGTHVWLNTKYEDSGQISILGNSIQLENGSMQTTETIVVAIVAIGIVVVAIVLAKKFNRR